ncbi:TlpA disulfide reductase family protein [Chitinophaga caseinilytica]|uniref:TlpA disulfide reductase family protein n=1 Tax=Chitinophaga caseinilytica TaxID=2267521 RepID=A0ABZ2YYR9_9BACT
MKQLFTIALCSLPLIASAQHQFEINGEVGNHNSPARVYCVYAVGDRQVLDSANIANGAFTLRGNVPDVTMVWLMLDHAGTGYAQQTPYNSDVVGIYVYDEKMTVRSADSMKNIQPVGSPLNDEGQHFYRQLASWMEKTNAVNFEWQTMPPEKQADPAAKAAWKAKSEQVLKENVAAKTAYVREHPDAYFSLMALSELINDKQDPAVLEQLLGSLSARWRESNTGKGVAADIVALRKTATGNKAPDFTQPDKDGNPVSLAQFKGKYLLVDFWASWCTPCRQENPNVVKAYNRFHPKGFEVLGVSLDDARFRNAWLEAIESDKLAWKHVSDLKGWQNAAAKLFAVKSIPQNFLLSPDGTILAVNLRGEALEQQLEKLLGK